MRTHAYPSVHMSSLTLKLSEIIKMLIYLIVHIVVRNLTGWAAERLLLLLQKFLKLQITDTPWQQNDGASNGAQ